MSLEKNALITQEFAKSIIGEHEFDEPAGEISKLPYLINTISSKIEAYVGRELMEMERVITVNSNNTNLLFLPVNPVKSVAIDGVDPNSYAFSRSGVIRNKNGVWRAEEYKITYTAGWTLEEVPYSIRKICIGFLISEKQKLNSSAFGTTSINMSEGTNISYSWDISLEDKKTLDAFKEQFI